MIINQVPSTSLTGLAETLAGRGHRVRLVAGRSAVPKPLANVAVIPCCDYVARSYASRIRSWTWFTLQAALYLAGLSADTVVVACTNPPSLPITAAVLRGLRGFAVITRVLDVYPDVLRVNRFTRALGASRLLGRLNRWAYARCQEITTLGETMAATLAEYVPRERISIIPEWIPPQAAVRDAGQRAATVRSLVVATGTIGVTHDVTPLLKAAALVRDVPIEFVISTKNPERLRVTAECPSSVRIEPHLPDEEYYRLLNGAFAAFISQRPCSEACSFPSRALTYLAHRIPIVAVTRRPSDLAALVDDHGCGIVIPSDQAEEGVAGAVRTLHADRIACEAMAEAAGLAAKAFSVEEWLPRFVDLVEATGARHRLAAGNTCGA